MITPVALNSTKHVENCEEFWCSCDKLRDLRDVCRCAHSSADGVLNILISRILSMVPPNYTLTNFIANSNASLNFYGAIIAKPGGGKSNAFRMAKNIIPDSPNVFYCSPASGESLPAMFAYRKFIDDECKSSIVQCSHWSAYLQIREVSKLVANISRQSSNLLGNMLEFWDGDSSGGDYTKNENIRISVPANGFRLVSTVAIQDDNLDMITRYGGSGLPQRILFARVQDANIRDRSDGTTPIPRYKNPFNEANTPNMSVFNDLYACGCIEALQNADSYRLNQFIFPDYIEREIIDLVDSRLEGNSEDDEGSHDPEILLKVATALHLYLDLDEGGKLLEVSPRACELARWLVKCSNQIRKETLKQVNETRKVKREWEKLSVQQQNNLIEERKKAIIDELKNRKDGCSKRYLQRMGSNQAFNSIPFNQAIDSLINEGKIIEVQQQGKKILKLVK